MFRGFGGRRVRRIARGRASSAQLDPVNVLNTGVLVTVVVVDVAWDDVGVIDPGHFVLRHHWLPLLVVVYSPYRMTLMMFVHLIDPWLIAKQLMISDPDLHLEKADLSCKA